MKYSTYKYEVNQDHDRIYYYSYYTKLESYNISINISLYNSGLTEILIYVDNKLDSDDMEFKEVELLKISRRISLSHAKKLAENVIKKKFDLVLIET